MSDALIAEMRELRAQLERSRNDRAAFEQDIKAIRGRLDRALDELEFLRTRWSAYLGSGVALTFMSDGRPIYVNALDYGGPSNLLNGGRYEDDNLAVLLSFVKPDTVFLDIGGNLGFFALQVAARTPFGHAHCFEPHPGLAKLMRMSAFVNGLSAWDGASGRMICHQIAVGASDGVAPFFYPDGHLGGGFLAHGYRDAQVKAKITRLDTFFPKDFACDLVKVDVEGSELLVFKGMSEVLARSPNVKILFEKLVENAPDDAAVEAFFAERGFTLYAIAAGARLQPLAPGDLLRFSGYVLAARAGAEMTLDRSGFDIWPAQLQRAAAAQSRADGALQAGPGETLYYGPYWELRAGVYRAKLEGDFDSECELSVLTHRAREAARFTIGPDKLTHNFNLPRDAIGVEFVLRAGPQGACVRLDRIRIEQAG